MNTETRLLCKLHPYRHGWVFLYMLIYIPWFLYLEHRVTTHYYLLSSPIDCYIPFVEIFVVPYLLWFPFMLVYTFYFFFKDSGEFYRLAACLIAGMTTFLLISTAYPNGLNLRPDTFTRSNIFINLVKGIYATDTPTNVLPSIHVFNTLAIMVALEKEKKGSNRILKKIGMILGILIILSTMFIKQHSAGDVGAAIILMTFLYQIVYAPQEQTVPVRRRHGYAVHHHI